MMKMANLVVIFIILLALLQFTLGDFRTLIEPSAGTYEEDADEEARARGEKIFGDLDSVFGRSGTRSKNSFAPEFNLFEDTMQKEGEEDFSNTRNLRKRHPYKDNDPTDSSRSRRQWPHKKRHHFRYLRRPARHPHRGAHQKPGARFFWAKKGIATENPRLLGFNIERDANDQNSFYGTFMEVGGRPKSIVSLAPHDARVFDVHRQASNKGTDSQKDLIKSIEDKSAGLVRPKTYVLQEEYDENLLPPLSLGSKFEEKSAIQEKGSPSLEQIPTHLPSGSTLVTTDSGYVDKILNSGTCSITGDPSLDSDLGRVIKPKSLSPTSSLNVGRPKYFREESTSEASGVYDSATSDGLVFKESSLQLDSGETEALDIERTEDSPNNPMTPIVWENEDADSSTSGPVSIGENGSDDSVGENFTESESENAQTQSNIEADSSENNGLLGDESEPNNESEASPETVESPISDNFPFSSDWDLGTSTSDGENFDGFEVVTEAEGQFGENTESNSGTDSEIKGEMEIAQKEEVTESELRMVLDSATERNEGVQQKDELAQSENTTMSSVCSESSLKKDEENVEGSTEKSLEEIWNVSPTVTEFKSISADSTIGLTCDRTTTSTERIIFTMLTTCHPKKNNTSENRTNTVDEFVNNLNIEIGGFPGFSTTDQLGVVKTESPCTTPCQTVTTCPTKTTPPCTYSYKAITPCPTKSTTPCTYSFETISPSTTKCTTPTCTTSKCTTPKCTTPTCTTSKCTTPTCTTTKCTTPKCTTTKCTTPKCTTTKCTTPKCTTTKCTTPKCTTTKPVCTTTDSCSTEGTCGIEFATVDMGPTCPTPTCTTSKCTTPKCTTTKCTTPKCTTTKFTTPKCTTTKCTTPKCTTTKCTTPKCTTTKPVCTTTDSCSTEYSCEIEFATVDMGPTCPIPTCPTPTCTTPTCTTPMCPTPTCTTTKCTTPKCTTTKCTTPKCTTTKCTTPKCTTTKCTTTKCTTTKCTTTKCTTPKCTTTKPVCTNTDSCSTECPCGIEFATVDMGPTCPTPTCPTPTCPTPTCTTSKCTTSKGTTPKCTTTKCTTPKCTTTKCTTPKCTTTKCTTPKCTTTKPVCTTTDSCSTECSCGIEFATVDMGPTCPTPTCTTSKCTTSKGTTPKCTTPKCTTTKCTTPKCTTTKCTTPTCTTPTCTTPTCTTPTCTTPTCTTPTCPNPMWRNRMWPNRMWPNPTCPTSKSTTTKCTTSKCTTTKPVCTTADSCSTECSCGIEFATVDMGPKIEFFNISVSLDVTRCPHHNKHNKPSNADFKNAIDSEESLGVNMKTKHSNHRLKMKKNFTPSESFPTSGYEISFDERSNTQAHKGKRKPMKARLPETDAKEEDKSILCKRQLHTDLYDLYPSSKTWSPKVDVYSNSGKPRFGVAGHSSSDLSQGVQRKRSLETSTITVVPSFSEKEFDMSNGGSDGFNFEKSFEKTDISDYGLDSLLGNEDSPGNTSVMDESDQELSGRWEDEKGIDTQKDTLEFLEEGTIQPGDSVEELEDHPSGNSNVANFSQDKARGSDFKFSSFSEPRPDRFDSTGESDSLYERKLDQRMREFSEKKTFHDEYDVPFALSRSDLPPGESPIQYGQAIDPSANLNVSASEGYASPDVRPIGRILDDVPIFRQNAANKYRPAGELKREGFPKVNKKGQTRLNGGRFDGQVPAFSALQSLVPKYNPNEINSEENQLDVSYGQIEKPSLEGQSNPLSEFNYPSRGLDEEPSIPIMKELSSGDFVSEPSKYFTGVENLGIKRLIPYFHPRGKVNPPRPEFTSEDRSEPSIFDFHRTLKFDQPNPVMVQQENPRSNQNLVDRFPKAPVPEVDNEMYNSGIQKSKLNSVRPRVSSLGILAKEKSDSIQPTRKLDSQRFETYQEDTHDFESVRQENDFQPGTSKSSHNQERPVQYFIEPRILKTERPTFLTRMPEYTFSKTEYPLNRARGNDFYHSHIGKTEVPVFQTKQPNHYGAHSGQTEHSGFPLRFNENLDSTTRFEPHEYQKSAISDIRTEPSESHSYHTNEPGVLIGGLPEHFSTHPQELFHRPSTSIEYDSYSTRRMNLVKYGTRETIAPFIVTERPSPKRPLYHRLGLYSSRTERPDEPNFLPSKEGKSENLGLTNFISKTQKPSIFNTETSKEKHLEREGDLLYTTHYAVTKEFLEPSDSNLTLSETDNTALRSLFKGGCRKHKSNKTHVNTFHDLKNSTNEYPDIPNPEDGLIKPCETLKAKRLTNLANQTRKKILVKPKMNSKGQSSINEQKQDNLGFNKEEIYYLDSGLSKSTEELSEHKINQVDRESLAHSLVSAILEEAEKSGIKNKLGLMKEAESDLSACTSPEDKSEVLRNMVQCINNTLIDQLPSMSCNSLKPEMYRFLEWLINGKSEAVCQLPGPSIEGSTQSLMFHENFHLARASDGPKLQDLVDSIQIPLSSIDGSKVPREASLHSATMEAKKRQL